MFKRVMALGALLLFSGAATAAAENRAESFTLTPFIGGYSFDGEQNLDTVQIYGIRAGYNFTGKVGVEAVFDYLSTEESRHGSVGTADVYSYHLDALYHFTPESRLVPFLVAGYGGMEFKVDNGTDYSKGALNYGAGIKYAITDMLHLRGEVRNIIYKGSPDFDLVNKETLSNYEYGMGLTFVFGGSRPAVAAVTPPPPLPKPVPAAVVAPPPPAPAAVAPLTPPPPKPAAPTAAIKITPGTIEKGAPAILDWSCQNANSAALAPGLGTVPVQGTRTVTPAESVSYTLTCSGDGGAVTSSAAVSVIKDTDTDGVFDNRDKCPGTPSGVAVDKDGCSPETLAIKLDVLFDTAKADIKNKYHNEIGKAAEFLKKYPAVTGVIEGHTDNVGSSAMNTALSQKRAESVMKYLVDKYGIDPKRLSAVGYGDKRPIADNKTAEGRQQNRRTVATFETVVKK